MTSEPEHLSADDMAGFLDRHLDPARHQRITAHLDGCAACRGELAVVAEIAAKVETGGFAGGHRRSRRWLPLTAALAAGLAGVLFYRQQTIEPLPIAQPVRAPSVGEGRAWIDIVRPGEDATVDARTGSFTWRASAADFYRLTLLSETGEPVWTLETTDTSVTLPSSVALKPGRVYFWRADAIAAGIGASTGSHRFVVAP